MVSQKLIESHENINNGIPKGYKKTKYGVFPIDWEVKRVNQVLKRVRKPVDVQLNTDYKQIGIRSHGKGIFYKESVKGKELGNKAVFWVQPDCFIVNIVFAWEMAVSRTTKNELGFIASHRFPMYKPMDNILDLDFITYLFKSPRGKYLLNLASPGGAGRNKTLGQKEFGELEIIVPKDVKEQKKIAEVLSTWDKAIELKESLIEQKEEQKRGLMQKLLSGDTRFPGFNGQWKSVPIEKVCSISMGKTPSRNENKYWGKGFKWIAISDLKEKYISKTKEEITELAIKETGIKIIPKGTVIMSFKLSLGKLGITAEDMYSNEAIVGFKNEDKNILDNEFLYYYLNHIDITKFGSRAAKGITLNKDSLKEIIVRFPQIEEQIKIREFLSTKDTEIELFKKEVEILKKQKEGLLQLLLTGKVRVKG
ncbi:restriction endonuclease subunit S [Oceanobacillus kimchii]|uniref:restriction endonuclease subunit S n=1 Tax=Oceanobacillus kimchii TaxID=746691 RepID=UPI003B02A356